MGKVIPFMHRQTGVNPQKTVENPQVLLFTGVRYERPGRNGKTRAPGRRRG